MRFGLSLLSILSLAFVLWAPSANGGDTLYKVYDLGTLAPGLPSSSSAFGMNQFGDVVGSSDIPGTTDVRHAFVWIRDTSAPGIRGRLHDIDNRPEEDGESVAFDINIHRQIVGEWGRDGEPHAALWYQSFSGLSLFEVHEIDLPAFYDSPSAAKSINDDPTSLITGNMTSTRSGCHRAFLVDDNLGSTANALPFPSGFQYPQTTTGEGICNSSPFFYSIAGSVARGCVTLHPPSPCQWFGTSGITLDSAFSSPEGTALDVNDQLTSVGWSGRSLSHGWVAHATAWTLLSGPIALPRPPGAGTNAPSTAVAINNNGDAVGYDSDDATVYYKTGFETWEVAKINDRLFSTGWHISELNDINNSGWMVGEGTHSSFSGSHAVLLVPSD